MPGHTEREVGEAAFLSSWHDDTPEGRSIISLAYERGFVPRELNMLALSEVQEFSASTRTSGVKITRGHGVRPREGGQVGEARMRFSRKYASGKEGESGSASSTSRRARPTRSGTPSSPFPQTSSPPWTASRRPARRPWRSLRNGEAIGIIRLKDVMKEGIKEKIQAVKTLGIRPVMITGDQPLTAKSIAAEVGITEYVPRTKPEDKFEIVKKEQAQSRIVAMIGDGTNDAPALAVADVGLAMNSGTEAAKEAANMVDLESNPAKIIDVVMLGKQLLMTRGAVTAFSIANDVAKYFAIMPVLFATAIPQLEALNILGSGADTAVLSALIFNAIIIPLLIPLAMRGVAFKPATR